MPRNMPAVPEYLRVMPSMGRPVGVDKEGKKILGYIVAEKGPFKSEGRGQFTDESLAKIVSLANQNPNGLKSRFAHPGASDDSLGKFLGRSKDFRLDGPRVRADLHLDPSSFNTPNGNLGGYVMDLADSDPQAFGSSLVLKTEQIIVLDDKGKPKIDPATNEEVPPIWMPTKLYASDFVDEGDAVHSGVLSSGGIDVANLPDGIQRLGWQYLDKLFSGQPRDVTEARCQEYLRKYLAARYGEDEPTNNLAALAMLRRRARQKELRRAIA